MSGGRRVDDYVDPEQQFILRLPDDIAEKLTNELTLSSKSNKSDKLSINIDPTTDFRSAKVKYDGEVLIAEIHDLPCIVESLKSTDNKSFYKTADISQIMITKRPDEDTSSQKRSSKKAAKLFQYQHGLTPPLKNVRKSRFRRILRKKYIESPDVENEVKTLLKSDLTAVSLPRYELVDADEKQRDRNRAELTRVFEEVSSEDDDSAGEDSTQASTSTNQRSSSATISPPPVNEQVKSIMREITVIQARRDEIRQTIEKGGVAGSEKMTLMEELELLRSKESTKLVYLDELRGRSTGNK